MIMFSNTLMNHFVVLIVVVSITFAWRSHPNYGKRNESKETVQSELNSVSKEMDVTKQDKIQRLKTNSRENQTTNDEVSDLEDDDMENMHSLRSKWYKEIPTDNKNISTSNTRRFENKYNFMFNDRVIDPAHAKYSDCFYRSRLTMRPYPNDCYSHTYSDDRSFEFWAIWGQIYGDFMYTFDFVLYDKVFPEKKENQFWYLIAYLKTLTLYIDNPFDIVSGIMLYKLKLNVRSRLQKIESRIEKLEHELSQLKLKYWGQKPVSLSNNIVGIQKKIDSLVSKSGIAKNSHNIHKGVSEEDEDTEEDQQDDQIQQKEENNNKTES